jgi:hypothetical protein
MFDLKLTISFYYHQIKSEKIYVYNSGRYIQYNVEYYLRLMIKELISTKSLVNDDRLLLIFFGGRVCESGIKR